MTSLAFTSEYLIAMVAATALASLIIYAVSTYSLSMHPSRAVVLASFALFAPISLGYRRTIHGAIAINRERQVFLVLGAGKIAQAFYTAYQASTNRERLRFIDVTGGTSGEYLAGRGQPLGGT